MTAGEAASLSTEIATAIQRSDLMPRSKLDAVDLGPSQVVAWLRGLRVGCQIRVVWPSHREGLRSTMDTWIQHFDDLWYPAAEDVWIAPENALDWVLEFSHEEVLTLYSAPALR
jgi:hypothetical protein